MKLELVRDEVELPWDPAPDTLVSAGQLLESVGPRDMVLQVVLTDDATLREHNREYRGKDTATDVLSFSYLEDHEAAREELLGGQRDGREFLTDPVIDDEAILAGQILISLATLHARGAVHAADLEGELLFMIVHGSLHVLGFDHLDEAEGQEMEAHERELMARAAGARVSDRENDGGGRRS